MRIWNLYLGAVAALALLAARPASGQSQWIYSVDFVCGFQASQASHTYEPLVKVANYATKLDVHNYGSLQVMVAAQATATSQTQWPATALPQALAPSLMPADGSAVIDCPAIAQAVLGFVPPNKQFLSGVVTLKSSLPLIVWATKTTQVCVGHVTYSPPIPMPWRPIYIDSSGTVHSGSETGPVLPSGTVNFDCPVGVTDGDGNVVPQGPFIGPGGSVPPGLRPPSDLIFPPPTPVNPRPNPLIPSTSIAHSIDFERVEGVPVP